MPLNQTLRKNSHVLWTISVIQDQNPDAQTKSEFAEMANDVINTNTIDEVTLCLADNLQRFRLMIQHGINEEEAILECQKMNNIWFMDNLLEIEKLNKNKNLSFLKWEEFLEWPEYQKTLEDVEKWYKENHKFKHDVDGRIRQELNRINTDAKIIDPTKQIELLKKYLFEEFAFQKFASAKRFNYEIYKNAWPPAMKDIKNNTNFVPPGFMIPLHFTQFELSTKKQQSNCHNIPSEKESFSPIFSKQSAKSSLTVDISISIKFAEFIEKTLKMLPPKEQEKAVEALMKFTTQEIIPLYYLENSTVMKI